MFIHDLNEIAKQIDRLPTEAKEKLLVDRGSSIALMGGMRPTDQIYKFPDGGKGLVVECISTGILCAVMWGGSIRRVPIH